jgi:carbon monoxide dehydrogenase subunit G
MIKAVVNIEVSAQHVFNALIDYPRYKEWIPGCEKCVVTASSGNSADTDIVVSGMKRIDMGLHFEAQPPQSLSFRMTRGKDLKTYAGTYRLLDAADGKGTVMVAELDIDPGGMIPKFMVDKMTRKMIDELVASLKKFIISKGAPAVAAAVAKAAAPAKPRRAKRILRVVKTADGYRVWLLGETISVRSKTS